MVNLEPLVAAIADEDRRLRALLDGIPAERRDRPVGEGIMSPKETVGHLAFWDGFTVRFFAAKLVGQVDRDEKFDFERLNREQIRQLRSRPWDEVLAAYDAATAELLRFLGARWRELSADERECFLTPLRHRRHHRLLLARSLRGPQAPPGRRQEQA